ncbi:hypothetical protein E2C01_044731 [Portunus trituberculatus]|uniref:Uncharacterized protein n=1 Tax=Portunus trituberculatus TaxID=210409 RepID=A0A5B7FZZ3_PORTR|nr:hypothetical protein [Portunus trituberculatus]
MQLQGSSFPCGVVTKHLSMKGEGGRNKKARFVHRQPSADPRLKLLRGPTNDPGTHVYCYTQAVTRQNQHAGNKSVGGKVVRANPEAEEKV